MNDSVASPWLLAVDLDGNLDREDEECRSLLRQLRAQGLQRVAIATAHPKDGIRVRGLGVFYEVDYLVLENGSVVLEPDGTGWRDVEAWLGRHERARADMRRLCGELLQRCAVAERLTVNYTNPPMEIKNIRIPQCEGLVRFEQCGDSFQLSSKEPPVFERTVAFVRGLIADLGCKPYEILDLNSVTYGLASKGEGVEFIAGLNGARLFTVAMGDSLNDIQMLTTCDIPCCPDNALPQIKRLVQERGGILAAAQRIQAVKEVLCTLAALPSSDTLRRST